MDTPPIKLLLVEDDKVDQMSFQRYVKKKGLPYDYTIAGSVGEARAALHSESFDIVVTDYLLGDGVSFELFEDIKNTPFIVVTGSGNEDTAVKAIKAGAYDYLIKDISGDYLTILPVTVENAMARKRAEQELTRYKDHLEALVDDRTERLLAEIERRKRSEEALQESERRFRALAENSGDTIMRFDRQHRHLYVNPIVLKQTGIRPEDFIGKTHRELGFPEELCTRLGNAIDNVFETGMVQHLEFQLPSSVWIDWLLAPETDAQGSIVAVISSARDITVRKKAEDALLETKNYLDEIINAIADPIFVKDREHRWVLLNDALCRLMGSDRKDLLGKTDHDFFPANEAEVFWAKDEDVFISGVGNVNEEEITDSEGVVHTIVTKKTLYTDVKGQLLIVGVIRDITELKRAGEALKESERHLADVIEFLPDATLVIDGRGTVMAWNKAMERMTGVASADMIGKGNYEYTLPFYGERRPILIDLVAMPDDEIRKSYDKVKRTGDLLKGDMDVPQVRGERRSLSGWAHPIYDVSGQIVGAIECIRDVTDKRIAEEALEKSEARYRLLAENASDIIFMMDTTLHFTYISPSVERIRGFTVEEVMQQSLPEIMTPASIEEVYKNFKEDMAVEALESKELWRKRTIELDISRKDGSSIRTETTISVLRDSDMRHIGYLGITRDITERKKAEEEKKRLEDQLAQAQKMEAIGTLAGGIAHDFNNILSAIIGYTELAKNDLQKPEKAERELGEVLKASGRAKDLVKHILTFSRKSEKWYSPVELPSLVKESLVMLRSIIPSTIEIHRNIIPSGIVMSDPTQIHQIIMNLCTNAVHAMDAAGGRLEVCLEKVSIAQGALARELDINPGPYVRLTVSDTGHGIPPELMERIFDPYFTTKEKGRGTGLGLSVVHGIVKNHQGGITCRSVPGEGTTFSIYLPELATGEDVMKPFEDMQAPRGTENVLIVDDEPVLGDMIGNMLAELGYKVVTETSSHRALEIFKKAPMSFDLVITDMTMPGMTGDVLAKMLLALRHDIPVILCTGYSEHISEDIAKNIGIREFIMKPIVMKELAKAIRNVLDGV